MSFHDYIDRIKVKAFMVTGHVIKDRGDFRSVRMRIKQAREGRSTVKHASSLKEKGVF